MRRGVATILVMAGCERPPEQVAFTSMLFDEALTIPSGHDLEREMLDAFDKKRRSDLDRALDALEPGEQLEHATLTQAALDTGAYSNDDLFRIGDDLFAYQFRPENGLGNALAGHPGIAAGPRPPPNMRRVHAGEFGGPDSLSCADCHSVGGDDGAGTLTQNAMFRSDGDRSLAADTRNAPALLGVGPIERLATEMSSALALQRSAAVAIAIGTNAPAKVPLSANGVAFGSLVARPDGSIDTSLVAGVSPDLIVRPFGWKGHAATLRDFTKESFRIHLGILSLSDQQAVRDGLLPAAMFGDGPWYDADADGFNIELDDGSVSTMVGYLSQLEVPVVRAPDDQLLLDRFARGRAVFDEVQCATCHVPTLRLTEPVLVTYPEQTEHATSPPITIDVARDGMRPKIEPVDLAGSAFRVELFSDLRRHDLGPELAAPRDQGAIAARQWLTRPLWGLADTAPYLHDGRAPTIDDAIRGHGGEAQASRDRFVALSDEHRIALLVYLASLQRTRRVVIP